MMASNQLNKFVVTDEESGKESIYVGAGAFKGWVPSAIYNRKFYEVHLPFLRLVSFPCGGASLGTLGTALTSFDATGNYLTTLPLAFAECRHLKRLDLSFNHFNQIPAVVYKLCRLEELNFSHNSLQYVERCIALLKNLKTLNLGGNLLTELPDELRKCKALKRLNLSGKFYAESDKHLETFPECVCHLSELIQLDLSWQQVDKIPSSISHLKRLEVLNLKWNQLVEVSKDFKKCSRLRRVDLTGAVRLRSVIPEALMSIEDLQNLNLSDNFFTEIPAEVCGLVKIKVLVAQRNSLLYLSPDLYKLRFLEYLELNQNYLRSLPDGIRQLKRLRYLSLDHNELTSLPDEIGDMENLRHLNVGNNQLTALPESLTRLTNLEYLIADNNSLREIPLLMDRLEKLALNDSLHISNNNLRSPYREMSHQGTAALFHFLKGIRVKEARHRWKMILIGAAHAGKTSLRRALMLGRSNLTEEHERTWVMERHLWEPESWLRVQVLDFGGHHIYQAAHHMFLSSDAFHVLVFDLSKYATELYHDLVGHWLDAIMDRACGATIVVAATHCDLCTKEDVDERTEDVLRLMRRNEEQRLGQLHKEIRRLTERLVNPQGSHQQGAGAASRGPIPEYNEGRLQQKLNSLQKMLNTRSKIPDRVYALSCAGELVGMPAFRSSVVTRLKAGQSSEMPDTWFRFLEKLQHTCTDNVVTFSHALDIFSQIMQDSPLSVGVGGSPERSLEMVLKYLHSTGELVWYPDNDLLRGTVFHKPEKLIDMLRAVFRHDFDTAVQFSPQTEDITALSETQFDRMKKNFLKRGLMPKEFMKYLLVHLDLSIQGEEDTFIDLILSLMIKFNLCFEVISPSTMALLGSTCVVQFPWFFPEERPAGLDLKWQPQRPVDVFELSMEIVFFGASPPNFFEKLSVKLQHFLSESDRDDWKHGVLAQKNGSTLLIQNERREHGTVISASARGGDDTLGELWSLIQGVRRSAYLLFPEWPMLKWDFCLLCAHCILKGSEDPYRYPGEVLETALPRGVYHKRCCDKSPEEEVPTCLVFPLEELDYQNDVEVYSRHVRAATDFLRRASGADDVDGNGGNGVAAGGVEGGILCERTLVLVANQLGHEWEKVAILLGVGRPHLQQMAINFPHDVATRILHTLIHWRDGGDSEETHDSKLEELFSVLASSDVNRQDIVNHVRSTLGLVEGLGQ